MSDSLLQIDDSFWNIRGSFRVAGLLDVGTQASLVRRSGGRFVMLDACDLDEETGDTIARLTDKGSRLDAIVNLHPFHTVHVEAMHRRFPEAVLVGTARHHHRLPQLPWVELTTDQPELHAHFTDVLEFSVPRGVDFISASESVHFSSVLAHHLPSKTIHVDDTFNYVPASGLLRFTPFADTVSFHPTLAKALQPRPGAAEEFRAWARDLIERWSPAENLCAAHTGALLATENDGAPLHERLVEALEKVQDTLSKHESRHG